jgi:hypothetical protein
MHLLFFLILNLHERGENEGRRCDGVIANGYGVKTYEERPARGTPIY